MTLVFREETSKATGIGTKQYSCGSELGQACSRFLRQLLHHSHPGLCHSGTSSCVLAAWVSGSEVADPEGDLGNSVALSLRLLLQTLASCSQIASVSNTLSALSECSWPRASETSSSTLFDSPKVISLDPVTQSSFSPSLPSLEL